MIPEKHTDQVAKLNRIIVFFENLIFSGRWLLTPMYVGLLVVLGVYSWESMKQVYSIVRHIGSIERIQLMLEALELMDTVMIANLIVMVMIGSYDIFVRKFVIESDLKPQWLKKINSTTLKIKMSMSLVGITSIYLLTDFVDISKLDPEVFYKHIVIHIVFLASTIVLAIVDAINHNVPESNISNEKH